MRSRLIRLLKEALLFTVCGAAILSVLLLPGNLSSIRRIQPHGFGMWLTDGFGMLHMWLLTSVMRNLRRMPYFLQVVTIFLTYIEQLWQFWLGFAIWLIYRFVHWIAKPIEKFFMGEKLFTAA